MKAKVIKYEKVFNIGNYESVRIGIELEPDINESASYVLSKAKEFVEAHNPRGVYGG